MSPQHPHAHAVSSAAALPGQRRLSRKVHLWVALAAASGALTAAMALPSAGAASTPPRCSTSNLTLEFVRGTAATGHRFWDLALRNVGPATCRLKGYPGAGLLNHGARLIHVSVAHVGGFAIRTVVLHSWQQAFFTFTYVSNGPCLPHFFSAYGLQIIPPGAAQRLVLYRGRFDVCSVSLGGHPGVYPVRPTLNTL